MYDENILRDKIRKIEALFERASCEGERQAAEAALHRVKEKLDDIKQTEKIIEMKFSFTNNWSRRLFVALCRRYSLKPYRYKRQRYTTIMLRVPEFFVNETLWPEFLEIDKVLVEYIDSITDRIISEEVNGDIEEAEEVNETYKQIT